MHAFPEDQNKANTDTAATGLQLEDARLEAEHFHKIVGAYRGYRAFTARWFEQKCAAWAKIVAKNKHHCAVMDHAYNEVKLEQVRVAFQRNADFLDMIVPEEDLDQQNDLFDQPGHEHQCGDGNGDEHVHVHALGQGHSHEQAHGHMHEHSHEHSHEQAHKHMHEHSHEHSHDHNHGNHSQGLGKANHSRGRAPRPSPAIADADVDKVRSTLRQFVRDWSSEGATERASTYGRICNDLEDYFAGEQHRGKLNVLVPGAGLGRLMFDIAKRGFSCQGNEFSFYMLLASNFILNRSAEGPFAIHPWIHSFSNHRSANDMTRAVLIPDVPLDGLPDGAEMSMVAGEFLEVYRAPDNNAAYDAVVTCFFIDTAHNVLEYLDCIHRVLKPGGIWINLGPLLYHYEGMAQERSVEFTLEEVHAYAKQLGFEFRVDTEVESTYTGNGKSLLTYVYRCSYTVAVRH